MYDILGTNLPVMSRGVMFREVIGMIVVEGNDNGVNVRPSVDKHHPTVVTWADVVREK